MDFLKIDVKRIISFLFILLMIGISVFLAYLGKEVAAGLTIIAFSFGLVFFNLDRFKKFKGAGFEAEIREVVTEAYAAIDELRKVAINVSEPAVSLLAVSGPFQHLPLSSKLEYAKNISGTLSDLNVSAETIENVVSSLYERVESDHKRRVLVALNNKLSTEDKIFTNYDDLNDEDWSVEKIVEFSNTKGVDVSDEITDFHHFISNRTLRDPANWQG